MPTQNNNETVNIYRFEDGPLAGDREVTVWPPPEEIIVKDQGVYTRVAMSQLPDELAAHPNLVRGCVFRWKAAADASV